MKLRLHFWYDKDEMPCSIMYLLKEGSRMDPTVGFGPAF